MGSILYKKTYRVLMLDRCRWWYFTLLTCFASGIVMGIFFSTAGMTEVGAWFSEDYFLVVFKKESISNILISRAINNFGIIVLMSICMVSHYVIPLNYLAMLYRGYMFGAIMSAFISVYSIAGVLLIVFVLIPIQFCYTFSFIIASVNGISCSALRLRLPMGRVVLNSFLVYTVSMAVALVEVGLIIIIVRPLNFIM